MTCKVTKKENYFHCMSLEVSMCIKEGMLMQVAKCAIRMVFKPHKNWQGVLNLLQTKLQAIIFSESIFFLLITLFKNLFFLIYQRTYRKTSLPVFQSIIHAYHVSKRGWQKYMTSVCFQTTTGAKYWVTK